MTRKNEGNDNKVVALKVVNIRVAIKVVRRIIRVLIYFYAKGCCINDVHKILVNFRSINYVAENKVI